jgi:hypothetical protein
VNASTQRFPLRPPGGSVDPLIPEARAHQRGRRIRLALVLAVLACAAGLAYGITRSTAGGHSGPIASSQSSAAAAVNPCGLLTYAEAGKALGTGIAYRTQNRPEDCVWTSLPLGKYTYTNKTLDIQAAGMTWLKFKAFTADQPGTLTPIRNLGRAAYLTRNGPPIILLAWQRGHFISVTSSGVVSSPVRTDIRAATVAISHIK